MSFSSLLLLNIFFDWCRELKVLAETLKKESDDSSVERKLNKLQQQVTLIVNMLIQDDFVL